MRLLAIASLVLVCVALLAAPLRAGQIYESEYAQCFSGKLTDPTRPPFDPDNDPLDIVGIARMHAECGLELLAQYERGEGADPLGPRLEDIPRARKKLESALRRVDRLAGKSGKGWVARAAKAHLRAADPRLHADQGFAMRGVNVQMHGAMIEQLAKCEVEMLELVERYDAQSTDTGGKLEQKALKFIALANLTIDAARTEFEAAFARQGEIRSEIDQGTDGLVFFLEIDELRDRIKRGYNLFATVLRVKKKAAKFLNKELDRQKKLVPCTLTDPDVPFQGGGTVTLSVDGGPVQVLENGTAGISIFRNDKKYFSVGTKTGEYPRIKLFHEGIRFRGKGTYPVARDPIDFSDPLPYKPTHAKGHYWSGTSHLDSDFHTTDSGTFTVTKYVLRKGKRRIVGTFDVVMSTDLGASVHLTGSFDVCGFQIESRDGID